jgi:hypothetical protein
MELMIAPSSAEGLIALRHQYQQKQRKTAATRNYQIGILTPRE